MKIILEFKRHLSDLQTEVIYIVADATMRRKRLTLTSEDPLALYCIGIDFPSTLGPTYRRYIRGKIPYYFTGKIRVSAEQLQQEKAYELLQLIYEKRFERPQNIEICQD